ncbi:MAG: T9SS type A sorting domain-containing protein [Planctomycetota bacterium]|jgi:hypothetical protein
MKEFICAITVFVAAIFASASATIINIPDDYGTIQEGIDASEDGDTVLVQLGTYVENINFNGHNIVLGSLFLTEADTSYISSTIIDGNHSGSVVTYESGEDNTALITGFTIQNGFGLYGGGGIKCDNNSSPAIIWCNIIDNLASTNIGIGGGGILCNNNSSPAIIRCNIIDNVSAAGGDDSYPPGIGGGIAIFVSSPVLEGCRLSGNRAESGWDWGNWIPGMGGGIYCVDSDPMISNNTISDNSAMEGAGIYCTGSSPIITNTILWGNDGYEIDGSPVVSYSDVQGGWEGEGNIDCDPLFCDPENSDFHLAENSCCVGAGENGVDIGALGVGCETTDINENQVMPYIFSLSQNYPNPFNASTSISFSLPQPGDVRLVVYDLLGREVETLLDDYRPAGVHNIAFDASALASGIYFYRVQVGDMIETKRMLLLK